MNFIKAAAAASQLVAEGIYTGTGLLNITGISPTLNVCTVTPEFNNGIRPINTRCVLAVGGIYIYQNFWDDGTTATNAQCYYQIWKK